MPLLLLFLLALAPFLSVSAQGNLSFEEADTTGMPASWIIDGNVKRVPSFVLGIFPFAAPDGNFFAKVGADTLSTPPVPGRLSISFPCADTPRSVLFHSFYLPRYTHQRYRVRVSFTRTDSAGQITLSQVSDDFEAVADSTNQVDPKWTLMQMDLGAFAPGLLPDTAHITIEADAVSPTDNATLLLLDGFRFDAWRTALDEDTELPTAKIYPNPAQDFVHVCATQEIHSLMILDATGAILKSEDANHAQAYTVDVRELQPGMYFFILQTTSGKHISKIMITK
jgi:hypothetical protein